MSGTSQPVLMTDDHPLGSYDQVMCSRMRASVSEGDVRARGDGDQRMGGQMGRGAARVRAGEW